MPARCGACNAETETAEKRFVGVIKRNNSKRSRALAICQDCLAKIPHALYAPKKELKKWLVNFYACEGVDDNGKTNLKRIFSVWTHKANDYIPQFIKKLWTDIAN